ncbi:hypothetical protein ABIE18_001873 [Arthrobacter sp. 2762]
MDIPAFVALQDWGSVPDWLAAVGTIGAVTIALRFGLRDGVRLAEERRESKADRELFRQQQSEEAEARKRRLAAKVTVIADRSPSGFHPEMGEARQYVAWTVHNGGDEPISMVSVVQRLRTGAPGADTAPTEISHTWSMIEPGASRSITTPIYDDPRNFEREREVQFTDGAGQRWQRKEFGALRSIAPNDPEAIGMVVLPG